MPEDIVKAKIVFDTSGVAGPMGKMAGGNQQTNKITGELGKQSVGIGKIAAGVAVGNLLVAGIKKGIDRLVAASPQLQATMKIFGKTLTLLLRPVGDLLSMVLRPFALAMLRWAIPFYKWARQYLKPASEVLKPTTGITPPIGIGPLDLETLVEIFRTLGESIKGIFSDIPENISEWWESFKEKASSVWESIKESFVSAWESISEISSEIWGGMVRWFDEQGAMIKKYYSEWGIAIKKWYNDTKETIVEKYAEWKSVIVTWYSDMKTSLKTFFVDTIPSFVRDMIAKVKELWANFKGWMGGGSGGQSTGGGISSRIWNIAKHVIGIKSPTIGVGDAVITPQGQVIKTDPKDYLIATKTPGTMVSGGKSNITININALDASSIDRNLIDKISSAVADAMQRGMSNRTSEFIGGF